MTRAPRTIYGQLVSCSFSYNLPIILSIKPTMLSQLVAKRTLQSSVRQFSTARIALGNDTPNANNDAFSDREKAQENVYVKKHEAEQLKALREKLQQQKESINKLENEINNIKK